MAILTAAEQNGWEKPASVQEHPAFPHGQRCEGHPMPAAACLGSDFTPIVVLICESQRFLQGEVNENVLDCSAGEAEAQECNDLPKTESCVLIQPEMPFSLLYLAYTLDFRAA